MTLAADFAAAATTAAMELPSPSAMHRLIDQHATPGIGAARLDGKVRGGDHDSQPERRTTGQRSRIERDGRRDQIDAQRAYTAAWDAIAALNAIIADAGEPRTWPDVVTDANVLAELDGGHRVGAWLDLDEGDVTPHVVAFVRSVERLAGIWHHWRSAPPTQAQQDGAHQHCRNHAQIGMRVQKRSKALCQWCWRQMLDLEPLGDPVELQLDPELWPPADMLRAHAEDRPVDVSQHRRDWLVSLGLDPIQVHNRRQQRRAG